MSLRKKFNMVMFVTLTTGGAGSGYLIYHQLQADARREITTKAELMMDTALSVRRYTVQQIRPNLDSTKSRQEFLAQSVPAYGATEVIKNLQANNPEYSYKEAALNPTNPRDKASDWEEDIINAFRRNPTLKEDTGSRTLTNGKKVMWLARPLRIQNEACLICHSTPDAAPATLIAKYGDKNGFGWKMNEVVAAQVVQVPMDIPINQANKAFYTFITSLLIIFAFSVVLMNVLLHYIVNRPVTQLTNMANAISKGDFAQEDINLTGKDEISILSRAILRMKYSLIKSMDIIRKQEQNISNLSKKNQ